MLTSLREHFQMRTTGSLTGFTGLGAMAATDLGAPLGVCWSLMGCAFFFLTFLIITTIRPHWVVYIAEWLGGFLDRLAHRGAPPHAT